MYESDLKYCPQCNDEYRWEIEQCAVCAVPLLSGTEMTQQKDAHEEAIKQRSMEFASDDELVTIFRGAHVEIKALEDILKKQRIPAVVAGDPDSCGKG